MRRVTNGYTLRMSGCLSAGVSQAGASVWHAFALSIQSAIPLGLGFFGWTLLPDHFDAPSLLLWEGLRGLWLLCPGVLCPCGFSKMWRPKQDDSAKHTTPPVSGMGTGVRRGFPFGGINDRLHGL